ncbi:argininosuccinate lyase [Paenibacillus sp. CGMCC 1.16610]|uniref:Argininosuccinate lyase n=1 Tax=Paenibacillus anseongense TaxID=2682845 RepID=A0ABW9U887_9BACL|nr:MULTISPECIES: argininosuccinate lyase [Paenibacillus]MBA2937235.1 argininosuccinate lyase [Paenibacillus sp. CGMCC 1.16610]MVQ36294.1 argininosuccinate lyase [Paenibacillus anseongense]
MGYREELLQSEGSSFPGKTYTEVVLEPAFNEAKENLLEPMMAINKAHLIMLREQKLITKEESKQIAKAIQSLDLEALRYSTYTGEFEDLFFQVENQLLEHAGDIAGNLHIARSRNDMGIAIYRMVLREKLAVTLSSALLLKDHLLDFAEEHLGTVMIGYTHTQQAQPTTLAHYMTAVIDSLNRDIRRMKAAYANCNRSSMGAAALTTSGFAISRERMMNLLAFDEIIENSYDAISGADYIGEIATAIQLAAINLGRVVQDLLLWCTQEFAVLKVGAPYVQISSIMPQKRNPVSLEHMRALLSSCVGNTNTILSMIHNTPFGDIVDTEDDMQPYAWKSLDMMDKLYRLLAAVMGTMEVNKEVLRQRSERSFATVTELADMLVRSDALSFRKAHHIVSEVVKNALANGLYANQITLQSVNDAARQVIGRDVSLDEEALRRAMDPVHFVDIRTLPGGPNPKEIKRIIDDRRLQYSSHFEWLQEAQEKSRSAVQHLDEIILLWSEAL